jgi:hypothetical protein
MLKTISDDRGSPENQQAINRCFDDVKNTLPIGDSKEA